MEAQNAYEALAILETHCSSIDVLFTDVTMPGMMDGLALMQEVHRRWPWIALLVASGKTTPDISEMPVGSRFMAKPYHHAHMIGTIQELAADQR